MHQTPIQRRQERVGGAIAEGLCESVEVERVLLQTEVHKWISPQLTTAVGIKQQFIFI